MIREALARVKLVGFSMFAAIAYGIAHDMVTAHVCGASLAAGGAVAVGSRLARELPAETHVRFLADGWAHGAAYLMAVVAVLVLAGNLLGTRIRRVKEESTRDALLGLPPARSDRGAE